jgi:hypothetical protein
MPCINIALMDAMLIQISTSNFRNEIFKVVTNFIVSTQLILHLRNFSIFNFY